MSAKEPRKQPSNERGKETVRILIAGARRIIERDGVTTLKMVNVASEAGVGIASLYQFFKTKDSLIAACEEQELSRLVEKLMEHTVRLHQARAPLDTALSDIVTFGVELFHLHMRRYFDPEEEDGYARRARREAIRDQAVLLVAEMLRERSEDDARLRGKDFTVEAFFAVELVSKLGYLSWQGTTAHDLPTFQREIGKIVTRYLLGADPAP